MKAVLKNYRQSPRKVRLVADLVRGKKVQDALAALAFANKRAAGPFAKVIKSAVANAAAHGKAASNLTIKKVSVDKGVVAKRTMPQARGAAHLIHRRSSHITIELG